MPISNYTKARRALAAMYRKEFLDLYNEVQKEMTIPAPKENHKEYKRLKSLARERAITLLCHKYPEDLKNFYIQFKA